MANPFFIDQTGMQQQSRQSLQGLGQVLQENREAKAAQQQRTEAQDAIRGAMQSGDANAMADVMIQYPEYQQVAEKAFGFANEQSKQAAASAYQEALMNPEQAIEKLDQGARDVYQAGGMPSNIVQDLKSLQQAQTPEQRDQIMKRMELGYAQVDPEGYKQFKEVFEDDVSQEVADIQTFEFLTEGLSDEEKAQAKRVKLGLSPRATESAVKKKEKAFANEAGKLEARYGLEPQVAGAVAAAKNEAKVLSDEKLAARSSEKAWNTYSSAMDNLAKAMGATATGPAAGFIPAVTANAQIAEGAVAVMSPVLKQMFRSAGEGTFTDRDQQMLLDMVPTRTDFPEAREAKIKAIDAIVRAKLDIPEEAPTEAPAQPDFDPSLLEFMTPEERALFDGS